MADYRMVVLTERLRLLGVLDTLTDQGPEVERAMARIAERLGPELARLEGGSWSVLSHAAEVLNGLLIVSFLVVRPGESDDGR